MLQILAKKGSRKKSKIRQPCYLRILPEKVSYFFVNILIIFFSFLRKGYFEYPDGHAFTCITGLKKEFDELSKTGHSSISQRCLMLSFFEGFLEVSFYEIHFRFSSQKECSRNQNMEPNLKLTMMLKK